MNANVRKSAKDIIRLYEEGGTLKSLAGKYQVGLSIIRRILTEHNVRIRDKHEAAMLRSNIPDEEEIEARKAECRRRHMELMRQRSSPAQAPPSSRFCNSIPHTCFTRR